MSCLQLPEGVNISKEARTAIGKAASIFILYATAWYVLAHYSINRKIKLNSSMKGTPPTKMALHTHSRLQTVELLLDLGTVC